MALSQFLIEIKRTLCHFFAGNPVYRLEYQGHPHHEAHYKEMSILLPPNMGGHDPGAYIT